MGVPLLKRILAIRVKTWGISEQQWLPTLKYCHSLLLAVGHQGDDTRIQTRIDHIQSQPSS